MQKYQDQVWGDNGKPLGGALIKVLNYPALTIASIYATNGGSPIAGQITADTNGRYSFYVADGHYSIQIAMSGYATVQIDDILLDDTIADNATVAALTAETTRAETAEGLLAPKASPTFTGTVVIPSATANSTSPIQATQLAASSGSSLVGANDANSGSLYTTVQGFITYLLSSLGSSIVGFIQSFTGSAPQTMQSKSRQRVHVEDFYANGVSGALVDPTGTIDSYLGIQAAFNTATTVETSVGATYLMSAGVTLSSNLRVVGGGTFKHAAGPLFQMFLGATVTNVDIDGIVIDGNSANVTSAANIYARYPAIEFSGVCTNIKVRNNEIKNTTGRGIVAAAGVSGGVQFVITDNYCHDLSSYMCNVVDYDNVIISGNRVENCAGTGIGVASQYRNCVSYDISRNLVDGITNDAGNAGSGLGITMYGASTFGISDITINGNIVRNCQSMCYSITPGNDLAMNLNMIGNVADSATIVGSGAGVNYEIIGSNVTFVGNTSLNPAFVHFSGEGLSQSVISNNKFLTSNNATLQSGIQCIVSSNSYPINSLLIEGNQVINNSGVAATSRCEAFYIVNQLGSAGFSDVNILSNEIEGDWRFGIYQTVSVNNLTIMCNKVKLTDTTNLGTGIQFNGNNAVVKGNYVSPKSTGIAIDCNATNVSMLQVTIDNNTTFSSNAAYIPFNFTAGLNSITVVYMMGNIALNTNTDAQVVGRDLPSSLNDYGTNSWNNQSAAPVSASYANVVGQRVWNTAPSVGNPKSWVCTVAGKPGTWVSEGNL